MKNKDARPNESASEANPKVDGLVEELLQQDVLPVGDQVEIPSDTVNGGLGESGRWDEPVGSHGTRAPRVGIDDDTNVNVDLVNEGLNEAEEELRDLEEEELLQEDDEATA